MNAYTRMYHLTLESLILRMLVQRMQDVQLKLPVGHYLVTDR